MTHCRVPPPWLSIHERSNRCHHYNLFNKLFLDVSTIVCNKYTWLHENDCCRWNRLSYMIFLVILHRPFPCHPLGSHWSCVRMPYRFFFTMEMPQHSALPVQSSNRSALVLRSHPDCRVPMTGGMSSKSHATLRGGPGGGDAAPEGVTRGRLPQPEPVCVVIARRRWGCRLRRCGAQPSRKRQQLIRNCPSRTRDARHRIGKEERPPVIRGALVDDSSGPLVRAPCRR